MVETLASAIIQVNNPAMQARAKEIGRLIQGEDGVDEALRQIEAHAHWYNTSF